MLSLSLFLQVQRNFIQSKDSSHQTACVTLISSPCLDIMVLTNHRFTSSIYLLSLVFLQRVNVEAYNFRDVKCLFRTYVFWWWRLSPVSVHPYMMSGICVEGCLGLGEC